MSKKAAKITEWNEAKKKCKLTDFEIQMAKELGMTPKSLIKNIPAKSQQWKAPVNEWVCELYSSKFGLDAQLYKENENLKNKKLRKKAKSVPNIEDSDLPF